MENIIVKKSNIDNIGIFSKVNTKPNDIIGIILYFKFHCILYKTLIGKYINHSKNNNCKCININGIYYLESIETISKNTELTLNYNDTPWFILGEWSI